MKTIISIVAILAIVQLSDAAAANHTKKDGAVCGKYQPVNITVTQLAGEWYVLGYGFNGSNDHPNLKCQKRKFTINADGVTGLVETSNTDPTTNKSRTFTSPFFVARPGVLTLGQEPDSNSTRALTVLHLGNNVLVYHLMTSGCGSGEKLNEPRIASRHPTTPKTAELVTILNGLPTAADFKDFREIPHTNCAK